LAQQKLKQKVKSPDVCSEFHSIEAKSELQRNDTHHGLQSEWHSLSTHGLQSEWHSLSTHGLQSEWHSLSTHGVRLLP